MRQSHERVDRCMALMGICDEHGKAISQAEESKSNMNSSFEGS